MKRKKIQTESHPEKNFLFTGKDKYDMMWLTKAKKRNSICLIRLQRAVGCCETAEDTQRTHLGAAA